MIKNIIGSLLKVAEKAHQLADNTEENDNGFFVQQSDFMELSRELDELDEIEELPEEMNLVTSGPARAGYWLNENIIELNYLLDNIEALRYPVSYKQLKCIRILRDKLNS